MHHVGDFVTLERGANEHDGTHRRHYVVRRDVFGLFEEGLSLVLAGAGADAALRLPDAVRVLPQVQTVLVHVDTCVNGRGELCMGGMGWGGGGWGMGQWRREGDGQEEGWDIEKTMKHVNLRKATVEKKHLEKTFIPPLKNEDEDSHLRHTDDEVRRMTNPNFQSF